MDNNKQKELETLIDGLEYAIQDAQVLIDVAKSRIKDIKYLLANEVVKF
jgi:hypothetical protein